MLDFKTGLSKLLIGPNLANDMQTVATNTIQSFTKAANKLKSDNKADVSPSVQMFGRTIQELVDTRLLNARASGKFKPLPRKGVTVGFHWLLPKPFGNDYRQEPWNVHASSDLVHVPSPLMSDVNPSSVQTGDWRTNIVPSPVGNDLVYMQ
mmetsp:Transcript_17475/g.22680  ORF Transcript_17475/g.22680 Transcript_17475/m.22680 type:complete len:151 (-) Transcript_17475:24-476(-)